MEQKFVAPRRLPHVPIMVLPDIITKEMCRELIAYWERSKKIEGAVSTGNNVAEVNRNVKVRTDVPITDQALGSMMLKAFAERVVPVVDHVFHYKITQWENLRIGCYDSKDRGFFGPHRDNTTPHTAHRHFALTLNLNHGEYKGGQLRFPEFSNNVFDAPTGGGCIFSCNLVHEALPVTRGRRFGVFCFFYNESSSEQQRRVQQEMEAQKARAAAPATV